MCSESEKVCHRIQDTGSGGTNCIDIFVTAVYGISGRWFL